MTPLADCLTSLLRSKCVDFKNVELVFDNAIAPSEDFLDDLYDSGAIDDVSVCSDDCNNQHRHRQTEENDIGDDTVAATAAAAVTSSEISPQQAECMPSTACTEPPQQKLQEIETSSADHAQDALAASPILAPRRWNSLSEKQSPAVPSPVTRRSLILSPTKLHRSPTSVLKQQERNKFNYIQLLRSDPDLQLPTSRGATNILSSTSSVASASAQDLADILDDTLMTLGRSPSSSSFDSSRQMLSPRSILKRRQQQQQPETQRSSKYDSLRERCRKLNIVF